MKSWEEIREEARKYRADVDYEVWRRGGNMDAVNYDRVTEGLYDGKTPEDCATVEVRAQRRATEKRELEANDHP